MPSERYGTESRLARLKGRAGGAVRSAGQRLRSGSQGAASAVDRRRELRRLLEETERRIDVDEGEIEREPVPTAERAARAARMGPPVEATLAPLEAPETAHALAGGRGNMAVGVSGRSTGTEVQDSLVVPDRRDDVEPLAAGGGMLAVDMLVMGGGGDAGESEASLEGIAVGGMESDDPLAVEGFTFGFGEEG